MFTMWRRGGLLGLVWLGWCCLPLRAPGELMPGADAKWRHYQSDHFEVYSRNGADDTRRLLHNLELVHAIFFQTFGFTPVRALPVTVYFFSRDKYFNAYKPAAYRKIEDIPAFYHGQIERGVMTVAPLPDYDSAQRLAFGCYAFHLLRLADEPVPTWYAYGISGVLRNIELNPTTFGLGKADPDQVTRLQSADLIPFAVMLGADQQSDAFLANQTNSLFHDESWAMLHYLYFGRRKAEAQTGINRFVAYAVNHSRNFDAGATQREFERQVGMTYPEMERALANYFRDGRYAWRKLPLPAVADEKSYPVRPVTREEINLRLAELAVQVNRSPAGRLTLLQAPEHSPEAARINEVLGSDAAAEGDWDVAADRWQQALAAGSTNPAVLHELCRYESGRLFRRFDLYYRLPDETAAPLRSLLDRSVAAEPRQTLAYELLAWVEATANHPRIPSINLIQRNLPRLKHQSRTLLALAVARMRLGDPAGAAEMLQVIRQSHPDHWVQQGVEMTAAKLENRPVNPANLPPAAASSPMPAIPIPGEISAPRD